MYRNFSIIMLAIFVFTYTLPLFAADEEDLIPPIDFQAFDTPSDDGTSLSLRWSASPSEAADTEYVVFVSDKKDGPFDTEALRINSQTMYEDNSNSQFHYAEIDPEKILGKETGRKKNNRNEKKNYFFKLVITSGGSKVETKEIASASPRGDWFNWKKLNNFVLMITFVALLLFFINHAKKSPNLFIRKISGLDAIDEALGRATEMGKPALFVQGLNGMGSISTIAAVNILGRVAYRIAEYDTTLKVSNIDPIVMSVSQEVVKESYLEAGRPDAYIEDNIFLAASEQFPYVAAVSGIMVREKPAANFFMGYFYAESLILAETGANTGAIQIAATDSYTQLPFFITTCDYTLIGEELYAASAYLSREPLLLGSLRAQDVGKGFLITALVLGTILATCGVGFVSYLFLAG
ncbi:MAG: hypothetical protein GY941_20515 [Planctomycetes bacterium]|nr:hypothetical protein [Planctomycetota bacterium]